MLKGMAKSTQGTASDLYQTDCVRYLAGHEAALIRDAYGPNGLTRPRLPAEEYISKCLQSAGELITACDQLKYALVYLSGYRQRRTPEGILRTRVDYIIYQIENFMMRTGTVIDRSLKLVNIAFELGIQPKDCRRSVIAENAHVASTPVRKWLDALEKALEGLIVKHAI